MTTLINSFKVKNFGEWKSVFNAHEPARTQAGLQLKGIYQSVEDENQVTVISQLAGGVEQMHGLMAGFKEVMEKSGVIADSVEIKIVSEVN